MADTLPEWSAGSNKMGERIHTKKWHENTLGPFEDWPQNLGLALDICLGADLPVSICWGPDLILFYNDAWCDLLGGKHPSSLGQSVLEAFSEAREEIEPVFEQVLDTGEAAKFPSRLLSATQSRTDGESYFDVTVNPIPGKDGAVGGTFNIATQIVPNKQDAKAGLFTIRERMNWLGGSLEMTSEPGKGTKAVLFAPVKDEEEESDQSARSGVKESRPSDQHEEKKDSRQKVRILLVDDHQMVRRGLRNMIEAQDDLIIIAEASDGYEAVELARETSPEVIVMDVNMPRMDGIEATRRISSDFPQVRIIGLSLHKKEDVAHSMQRAGAYAYLTKDQAFETLCSTIRRVAGPERDESQ